ncbi:NADH dehydrogenase 1 alpha subcomplex assembly factor [Acrasis kona]|uniref:NADH dehydrogenase 1 alpha subcomplex assembly factor n=1 Tax=Acrasis kona TaxID=1008807 RepID=A0AAW2Z231_9EUKA
MIKQIIGTSRFKSIRACFHSTILKNSEDNKTPTFNRRVLLHHKDISANYGNAYDYIRDEIAEDISDRLVFLTRDFPNVLELGSGKGHVLRKIMQSPYLEDKTKSPVGIQNFHLMDGSDPFNVNRIHQDEEECEKLDDHFKDQSLDMVVSSSYLHWANNHQQLYSTIMRKLKPDGAFFGALIGGDTLFELRSCLVLAEQEREGGVSPHISPMVGIRDVGNLLNKAGFALPTIDTDVLTVYYPDAFTAMRHIQYMGENNALLNRRPMVSRETLLAAAAIYDNMYYDEQHKGVPATFEIMYFVGWSPDPTQPKSKRRGSATVHMKDLAKTMNTQLNTVTTAD